MLIKPRKIARKIATLVSVILCAFSLFCVVKGHVEGHEALLIGQSRLELVGAFASGNTPLVTELINKIDRNLLPVRLVQGQGAEAVIKYMYEQGVARGNSADEWTVRFSTYADLGILIAAGLIVEKWLRGRRETA